MLRAIDLFSGAGGLTRGLVNAGFNVVGGVENWLPAARTYQANFPSHPCWQLDVSRLNETSLAGISPTISIDLVAGGPPCQGFSRQRIGEDHDDRNKLVLSFAEAVLHFKSRAFLMENVTGLLGGRGKETVAKFRSMLETAGYHVEQAVLDAVNFGVPQARKRVFFIGWRNDEALRFRFPQPHVSEPTSVSRAFEGLELLRNPGDTSGDPLHKRTKLSPLNQLRLSHVPPGGGFEDIPVELRANCHKAGASKIGHRGVYGRLHPDQPAATITARFDSFTRGRFAHPTVDRNITLREGARLQGFPDEHVFLGSQEEIAAQIGNAIPPPLATAVCKALFDALSAGHAEVTEQLVAEF
jgi:DNA (cytosine-5)-methyltransferase 1